MGSFKRNVRVFRYISLHWHACTVMQYIHAPNRDQADESRLVGLTIWRTGVSLQKLDGKQHRNGTLRCQDKYAIHISISKTLVGVPSEIRIPLENKFGSTMRDCRTSDTYAFEHFTVRTLRKF